VVVLAITLDVPVVAHAVPPLELGAKDFDVIREWMCEIESTPPVLLTALTREAVLANVVDGSAP
jgi:hypothetical protein